MVYTYPNCDINGVLYDIVFVDNLQSESDEDGIQELSGRVKYGEAIIEISRQVPERLVPNILLHEAIHAILYQAGHVEHDEGLVVCLAYAIRELMMRNLWLAELLQPNVSCGNGAQDDDQGA